MTTVEQTQSSVKQSAAFTTTHIVSAKASPYHVFIGKRSVFENPFFSQADAMKKYKAALWKRFREDYFFRQSVLNLDGKTLGCTCSGGYLTSCHGHALISLLSYLKRQAVCAPRSEDREAAKTLLARPVTLSRPSAQHELQLGIQFLAGKITAEEALKELETPTDPLRPQATQIRRSPEQWKELFAATLPAINNEITSTKLETKANDRTGGTQLQAADHGFVVGYRWVKTAEGLASLEAGEKIDTTLNSRDGLELYEDDYLHTCEDCGEQFAEKQLLRLANGTQFIRDNRKLASDFTFSESNYRSVDELSFAICPACEVPVQIRVSFDAFEGEDKYLAEQRDATSGFGNARKGRRFTTSTYDHRTGEESRLGDKALVTSFDHEGNLSWDRDADDARQDALLRELQAAVVNVPPQAQAA